MPKSAEFSSMPPDFSAWSRQVARLAHALSALRAAAERVGVPPPRGEEWFELLQQKLLPQLGREPLLVVAVVGGTNIGKSVVFNHLAGETASRVSPLAAGTRHPVCLVPTGFADQAALEELFEDFRVRPWQSPDDPLTESPVHLLFWRVGDKTPPRLLLLDTPDIDSDAQVNWQRADHIRRSADVLVAVLTQQKYNDAAVKRFFRAGVEADKPVIVLFNQCDLEQDRDYWPQWLATFAAETGARPELVYVAPYDRGAATTLELPFYEVGPDGRRALGEPAALREELAALQFDRIKIRTFRGAAAKVLDPAAGAPAYLQRIRRAGGDYAAAAAALSTTEMARIQWPGVPASLLVEEIRQWWDTSRGPWSRKIHGFYRVLGQGVLWPVRKAWSAVAAEGRDPVEVFQAQERACVVQAVQKVLDELDRMSQVGNDILRPRLQALLGGAARRTLLQRVEAAHAELPAVDDDYRTFLRGELEDWTRANPRVVGFLRSLDRVAAVARPAITVSLVVSGWIVAGSVVGDMAVHAAGHTATGLATEAAITGGIAGGGEALVGATGEGVKQAAARLFRRLQNRYAESRADWLAGWLERELLGDLLVEMRRGADVARGRDFAEVEAAIAALSACG